MQSNRKFLKDRHLVSFSGKSALVAQFSVPKSALKLGICVGFFSQHTKHYSVTLSSILPRFSFVFLHFESKHQKDSAKNSSAPSHFADI